MSVLRFFAVVLIFLAASGAWALLAGTTWVRTEAQDSRLSQEMASLWGPERLIQPAPYWSPTAVGKRTEAGSTAPAASKITADFKHANRYKGLLWYSTFEVAFAAEYTFDAVAEGQEDKGFFLFRLPEDITSHDGLKVTVDGKEVALPPDQKAKGALSVELSRQAERVVSVSFATYGQDQWLYAPVGAATRTSGEGNAKGLAELTNFSLTVTTDFRDIDYPSGSRSPTQPAAPTDGGMKAGWQSACLVTNQMMGLEMPRRQNAGDITTRMAFFAPVSLFFFFTVLFTVTVLKKLPLHPMHYLFISAGFFAFHILMAYLADLLDNIHLAFWLCAATSVFLVVTYMRLVAGAKFAIAYAGLAQMVYLVGFSYAFFWKGRTGLTVTIGAIVTLFVLMQATGKVDWFTLLKKPPAAPPPPPPDQPALTPTPRP